MNFNNKSNLHQINKDECKLSDIKYNVKSYDKSFSSLVSGRLDFIISNSLTIPRSKAQKIISNNLCLIDNEICNEKSKNISQRTEISISNDDQFLNILNENGSFMNVYGIGTDSDIPDQFKNYKIDILYEDKHIAIINKPAGIASHGSANDSFSLVTLLAKIYDINNFRGYSRPFIAHRLDKDTSGAMIIAKTCSVLNKLLLMHSSIIKKYLAVIHGEMRLSSGIISLPIQRNKNNRMKMAIGGERDALTEYLVVMKNNKFSILDCKLHTGRTHQIRVHMSYSGNYIIGDKKYNPIKTNLINRQALHAYSIKFTHPITENEIDVKAPLPQDINDLISKIGFDKSLGEKINKHFT